MTNTNTNTDARDAIKSLVFEALPKAAAERDARGGWRAVIELATGHLARDSYFSGRSVVIRVITLKRGGNIVTRASLEAKLVENGYVSYGFSTNGFTHFRLETSGRATERAINAQHIQALCSPAFELWAIAAMSYAAAGGQV